MKTLTLTLSRPSVRRGGMGEGVMKRVLKLLISLVVRGWDILRIGLLWLIGRQPPSSCVVLYYHGIQAAQRERFARQMDELLRLTRPLRAGYGLPHPGPLPPAAPAPACLPWLTQAGAGRRQRGQSDGRGKRGRDTLQPGGRYSAVTFDDGFVSVLNNALPELEQRGIPATWFIPSGCLGRRPPWLTNPESSAWQERILTEEQLVSLKDHPMLSVGSHSVTHPRLPDLLDEACVRELRQSKSDLERILGQQITEFSFPHGKCDERSIQLAKAAGYKRVFTIQPALALRSASEFVTGRVAVDPEDWRLEFRLKLLGAYRWGAFPALRNWRPGRNAVTKPSPECADPVGPEMAGANVR